MNKRQIIILWAIAVALAAAVTAVKFGREKDTKSSTARSGGQTLFESFPAAEVASIEVKGAAATADIVKKDGKWIIPARENYPASVSDVNGLLRTLSELKIAQGMQAGPSFASHFGMDETSKDAKQHGLTATFKDASGKQIAQVTIGKTIESATAAASPMGGGGTGRFVRNHADESGFYAVGELFSSLSDQPTRWLNPDFIAAEKVQSVSVSQPGKADEAWKVVRANEEGEFALEGAAAGETLDPAAATAFKSIFGYAHFEDIVPAAEIEKRAQADQKRVAKIVTFEGFTYTITFTPTKPGSVAPSTDPENNSPPPDQAYLTTVEVTAEIPKERKKPENEKPEEAKAKDEAFAARSKELTEKLAKEKAFSGYTYQVAKETFDQIIKDRAGLLKKPEAANAAPAGGNPNMPTFRIPAGGISATTPPIEATMPPQSAPPAEEAK